MGNQSGNLPEREMALTTKQLFAGEKTTNVVYIKVFILPFNFQVQLQEKEKRISQLEKNIQEMQCKESKLQVSSQVTSAF